MILIVAWYDTGVLKSREEREGKGERGRKGEREKGEGEKERGRGREREGGREVGERLVIDVFLQVNEEFVKLSEAYFVTKYNVDTAEGMLRSALMEPRTAGKTVDVEHEKVIIKCLKMVSIK